MIILDPTSERVRGEIIFPKSGDLKGKIIGILTNHWLSMDKMTKTIEKNLKGKYGVLNVNYYDIPAANAASEEVLKTAVVECDAAIVGLAN